MEETRETTDMMVSEETEQTTAPVIETTTTTTPSSNQHQREQQGKKKRPRDVRVQANERLCLSVSKGIPCPFKETCKYEHDGIAFLSSKPPDLGPVCHRFMTYGFCPSGLMCRYGDCHIDRATGMNLSRKEEDGGVIETVAINVLSKELQHLLRKKKYPYKNNNNNKSQTQTQTQSSTPATAPVTATTTTTEAPIAVTTTETAATATTTTTTTTTTKVDKSERFHDLSGYDKKMKLVDFSNKVYIAPLTTVGNLPFRRILKEYGADITVGEMSMAQNIEEGQSSEWALFRRHESESVFGVQLACQHVDQMKRVATLLENETSTDFVDLNCGCPIDVVCNRGCGSALLQRPQRLCDIVNALTTTINRSVTVKIRTGWSDKEPMAHKLLPKLQMVSHGKIAAVMIHGRSRQQRYSKLANWQYVLEAAQAQNTNLPLLPVIGNGDILTWEDWAEHRSLLRDNMNGDQEQLGLCSCAMVGRGALIKPWLPTEIKDSRHFDISASERLEMLQKFVNYGLEHWGSDTQGVNTTRRFLLEWLSFLCRYAPAGLLETAQKMQIRPPVVVARSDLEQLLSSPLPADWIKISEMLLGSVPENFHFEAKHKSDSYGDRDNRNSNNNNSGSNNNNVYDNNDDDQANG